MEICSSAALVFRFNNGEKAKAKPYFPHLVRPKFEECGDCVSLLFLLLGSFPPPFSPLLWLVSSGNHMPRGERDAAALPFSVVVHLGKFQP